MRLKVDSGKLPMGWEVKKLGEVCNILTGKLNANAAVENGKYPFFTCSREIFAIDYFAFDCEAILLAGNNAVGDFNVKHYKGKFNAYQRTYVITINQEAPLLYKYLYVQIENALKEFKAKSVGAGTKFLKLDIIKNLKIHLPPLPEQKRIVAILDEAFEGIDRAIANTEKNLANSRELFESYLNSIFTQKGDGWEEKKLGEVCQFENGDRGKNYPNREEYVESGIPWINTGHIQPNGTLSQSEMNFITQEKYESLRSGKIRPGDLVYCLRGATIGKTALVAPFTVGAVASSLVIIRPSNLLDSHFLYYFLTSSVSKRQIKLYDNGAAQPNLGAKSVAKYIIFFPTLAEQKVIVQKLLALATETQRLETIYRQKLASLNELKQSILQKAFTGELTVRLSSPTTADIPKTVKEEIAA